MKGISLKTSVAYMLLFSLLFLVLYCEKKHGTGKPLKDYSGTRLPEPPAYARNGILYELYIRSFTDAGTFKAAETRLDHLVKLDVDIVWLMPVYPIGEKGRKGSQGSPYSVRDFRTVNPEYGSEEDFRHLVQEIHRRGMKVILDIVPNHAANDNVLMKNHPDWFLRDENGQFTREVAAWSDVTDFNYDNPEMRKYMAETLEYWIREYDIDGYRCDVAGMVPYDFWKKTIPRLKALKPDIYLLAEWEDPELLIAGFHSDYDWTLYHLLKDIRKGKKRTSAAVTLVEQKDSLYPHNALPMRFIENHDELRSLDVFGVQGIDAYARFLFTLPGIPLIYAGQEIGERHKPSLFEREPLNWENADAGLFRMYQELIRTRKRYSCFTEGGFQPLQTTMMKGSAAAFLREDENSAALVITNLRAKNVEKLLITIDKSTRQRLGNLTFHNPWENDDTLSLSGNIFREQMLPFTTLVYVVQK